MAFLNLKKNESRLFYITVALIVFWFAQVFVIKPIAEKWFGFNDKIFLSRLKLEKSQRMIEKKEAIRQDYDRYASALRMTGSEEEEMAKFLTEIESLSRFSSVYISDIKPQPIKKVNFYKKYFVELEAQGDINQISKLMSGIQQSPQLLKIDKFSLGTKNPSVLRCRILVSKILIP